MWVEMNVQVTGADPAVVAEWLSAEDAFYFTRDHDGHRVVVATWYSVDAFPALSWAAGLAADLNQEAAAVAMFSDDGAFIHGECVGPAASKWPFDIEKFVRY